MELFKWNVVELEEIIRLVKKQVMEYLESNEEARLYVDEALRIQEMAAQLDPEGQQERMECEWDGQNLHPDFEHLSHEELTIMEEKKCNEKQFRPI